MNSMIEQGHHCLDFPSTWHQQASDLIGYYGFLFICCQLVIFYHQTNLCLLFIQNFKQHTGPTTPMSTANLSMSIHHDRSDAQINKTYPGLGKRLYSSYNIKVQELSALKQRIKIRNKNKENNPLFRSQNLMNIIKGIRENDQNPHQVPNHTPLTVKLSDFEIGDLLGKGAAAKVRLAIHKSTGTIYSIKTMVRDKVEKKLDSFIKSLKMQMYLNHPNIAKIYGIIVEERYVHLIMQFCNDGDLSMNLSDYGREEKNLKNILLRISLGLQYLHKQKIQHRDLKLENVLLSYGVPKITDFELSVYTKLDFFPRKTICGSPAYFCPEMVEKQRYNKKADVWCLGIIFFQLLCGFFPFEINNMQDVSKIGNKQMKVFPPHLSPISCDLIEKMLEKESDQRISISQVVDHEFFRDEEGIESQQQSDKDIRDHQYQYQYKERR